MVETDERPDAGWFDALGKPVPPSSADSALDLLVKNGCDAGEASLVLSIVCREIAHDEPERAQRYLRGWLPKRGSEVLLMMVLATLATPEFCHACQHEHRDGPSHACRCPDCGVPNGRHHRADCRSVR